MSPRHASMLSLVLSAGLLGSIGVQSRATVLTFEPVDADDALIPQSYGDRVSSTPLNGFNYGPEWGFTPNVTVEWRPTIRWRHIDPGETGFGDLQDFAYREDSGNRIMEILFFADAGWNICLHEFDLAAKIGEALPVKAVRVTTGTNVDLFRVDFPTIPDILEPRPLPVGVTGTPTHMHFSFDPAICNAPFVKIRIELDNLGFKCDQIAIDNIGFGQMPVPAPGTGVMVGAGMLLAARRRRH